MGTLRVGKNKYSMRDLICNVITMLETAILVI